MPNPETLQRGAGVEILRSWRGASACAAFEAVAAYDKLLSAKTGNGCLFRLARTKLPHMTTDGSLDSHGMAFAWQDAVVR